MMELTCWFVSVGAVVMQILPMVAPMQTTETAFLGNIVRANRLRPTSDIFLSVATCLLSKDISLGVRKGVTSPKHSGSADAGVLPVITRPREPKDTVSQLTPVAPRHSLQCAPAKLLPRR